MSNHTVSKEVSTRAQPQLRGGPGAPSHPAAALHEPLRSFDLETFARSWPASRRSEETRGAPAGSSPSCREASHGEPGEGVASDERPRLPSGDSLLELTLSDFAHAELQVVVFSRLLGEEVVFASDNAEIADSETRTIYRARELRSLAGLGAADLHAVHRVKSLFTCSFTSRARRSGASRSSSDELPAAWLEDPAPERQACR